MKTITLIASLFLFGCAARNDRIAIDAYQAFVRRSDAAVSEANSGSIDDGAALLRIETAFSVYRSTMAASKISGGLDAPFPVVRCADCGGFAYTDWKGASFCSRCMDGWGQGRYWRAAEKEGAAPK